MFAQTPNPEGLFPVRYTIGTGMPGAPTMRLNLLVYTPDRRVSGMAIYSSLTSKEVVVYSHVTGAYTYLGIMPPERSSILLTAEGDLIRDVRMVLDHDWMTGIASYRYFANGEWHSVENQKVRPSAAALPPVEQIPSRKEALKAAGAGKDPVLREALSALKHAQQETKSRLQSPGQMKYAYEVIAPGFGSPVLSCKLVDIGDDRVNGMATLYHSNFPSTEMPYIVWGNFGENMPMPGTGRVPLQLDGYNAWPAQQPNQPTPRGGVTFRLHAFLDEDKTEGPAIYRYLSQGGWQEVRGIMQKTERLPDAAPVTKAISAMAETQAAHLNEIIASIDEILKAK